MIQLHNPANRDFPLFDSPGNLNEAYPGLQEIVARATARAARTTDPIAAEYSEDRELQHEALRTVAADPLQAVRAAGRSFLNMWRVDYPTASRFRWITNCVLYIGLLPFVTWGTVRALRSESPGPRLLVGFLAYFVFVHALLASEIRYRISAMPAFFLLAAFGAPSWQDLHGVRRLITPASARMGVVPPS
jgi:hypothetical protein